MIRSMRRLSLPGFIEWLAVTIRWIVLMGLASWLIVQGAGTPGAAAVLIVAAAWNSLLTFLAIQEEFIGGDWKVHRIIVIALDLLIANLLFYLTNIGGQALWWVGLLPVISGALYFELQGLALVVLVALLTLGSQVFLVQPGPGFMHGIVMPAVVYGLAGALILLLRRRAEVEARKSVQEQVKMQEEGERAETERRRALYNLIAELSATLNYQRVLDIALDMSARAMAGSASSPEPIVSAALLFSEQKEEGSYLKVGSARRFTPADRRIELPGKEGLLALAIDTGESSLTNNPASDAELSRVVALRSCRSAYCVPLRNGRDTYGVMLFAHPEEAYFSDERREILDIVGHQAMIALQNARLYQDLETEKERIIELQEEARRKLARDLHDGPTQSVAALAMRVNFARRLIERDASSSAEELAKIEDLARRTSQELRHMLFTLRPLVLESQGLSAALESMAEKMREMYNQNVLISVDEQVVEQLEMNKQGVLFFLAEEAVNNARKHARAAHIWVRLKRLDGELAMLEICDDGVGFDIQEVAANYEQRGSLGMVNLQDRAELINSVLRIDSTPDSGTSVQVVIPLTAQAADRIHGRK